MYTIVTTTYNDLPGLKLLINSIFDLSILPSEIIIIDSLSTDSTQDYIKGLAKNSKINFINVYEKHTIGGARNYGVKISSNDYVLISDTYCILDKYWAENILEKLRQGYSFVGGGYSVIGNSCSQIGYSLLVSDGLKSEKFNPSSRSIGFIKKDFLSVGSYPNEYNQGEDSKFNINIINSSFNYIQLNSAFVKWYGRSSFKDLFRQYKRYAIGDLDYKILKKKMLVFFFLHPVINILFLFTPFLFYVILILFLLILKNKLSACSFKARIAIDFGTTIGISKYLLNKII
jgi:glycosyltransferase involved in cell wall biosynthesis